MVADWSGLLRNELGLGSGRLRPGGSCVEEKNRVGQEAVKVVSTIEVGNCGGRGRQRTHDVLASRRITPVRL